MADEATYQNALPLGSMLLEYRLESVLGMGGFGMTYLAWDTHLEKHVAIKEYLPCELAVRALDGSIVPVNTQSEFNYKWGLDRFIQEARTLARFSHPNIVRVNRFFEANGTSYMVMDYEAGESMNQYLKHSPMPDEATLKKFMLPILDGLQAVHQAGFLHRDIKPSNVFLRENGPPLLIDFGSARLATGAASETLTSIVSPGYAPIEQYMREGHQGPWTDIYALSGVVYRAVTGNNPPDAVSRMKSDGVPAALTAARTRYDERFLRAIEWGLRLDEAMRPQTIAEWRELFSGRLPMSALNRTLSPQAGVHNDQTTAAANQRTQRAAPARRGQRTWLLTAAVIVVLIGVAALVHRHRGLQRDSQTPAVSAAVPAAPARNAATENFETADADRSGSISREEMTERLPRYASRFDEIDTNKDGVVSIRELEQFLQNESASEDARQAAAKSAPADAASQTAPASEKAEPPPAPSSPPKGTEQSVPSGDIPPVMTKEFMRADANGDGYLTPSEVRGYFPAIERNFTAVDTNGDGRLSLDEVWQFRRRAIAGKSAR